MLAFPLPSCLGLVTVGAVRLIAGRSGVGSAYGRDGFLQPWNPFSARDLFKLTGPFITFKSGINLNKHNMLRNHCKGMTRLT